MTSWSKSTLKKVGVDQLVNHSNQHSNVKSQKHSKTLTIYNFLYHNGDVVSWCLTYRNYLGFVVA
jgi:hypothetical protein